MLRDAIETGAANRAAVEALAREWLVQSGGDLALRILTGAAGAHEAAAVTELCKRILHATGADSLSASGFKAEGAS